MCDHGVLESDWSCYQLCPGSGAAQQSGWQTHACVAGHGGDAGSCADERAVMVTVLARTSARVANTWA